MRARAGAHVSCQDAAADTQGDPTALAGAGAMSPLPAHIGESHDAHIGETPLQRQEQGLCHPSPHI